MNAIDKGEIEAGLFDNGESDSFMISLVLANGNLEEARLEWLKSRLAALLFAISVTNS